MSALLIMHVPSRGFTIGNEELVKVQLRNYGDNTYESLAAMLKLHLTMCHCTFIICYPNGWNTWSKLWFRVV